MNELDITEGLSASAWEALKKAVDSNDQDTVYEFLSFFRGILTDSIKHRKIKYFKQFALFPSHIYWRIAHKSRQNAAYQSLVKGISEQLSLHLREIIDYYFGSFDRNDSSDEEKKLVNEFYYEAFNSFNDLLYRQAMNQDWILLEGSLKRFSQLGQGIFDSNIQEEIRLRDLMENNIAGVNDEEIETIKSDLQIAGSYKKFKRQPIAAIRYWLFLLFDKELIQAETLLNLLSAMEKIRGYDPGKETEDILFFRTADLRSYMGWENWDFTDRPEGEVYYPPMPSQWMTRGFIIDRIRTNNAYFNTNQIPSDLLNTVPFFYDAAVENINSLRENIHKWLRVLRVDGEADFNTRADSLLRSIASAKRSVVGNREREIAAAPLSQNLIAEFRETTGKSWKAQTRIRRVFEYFGNIADVTSQDILLKRVGQNIFFEKAKMMFIDGAHHQQIYGMERLGGNIGRWEDDLFLEVIQKADTVNLFGKTILETVIKCIDQLKANKIEPTMIYLEPEYLYKDESFLKSERYSSNYDGAFNPEGVNFYVLGTFDNIPLFTSHSRHLKNKIVVADFAAAFLMQHKTNQNWFEGELSLKVLEVTDELANDKYISETKWQTTDEGINLSEPDAKVLIKTSVIIDIETIVDFKVIDPTKFIIGQISEPIAD